MAVCPVAKNLALCIFKAMRDFSFAMHRTPYHDRADGFLRSLLRYCGRQLARRGLTHFHAAGILI
jgi:hypothetical protein